MVKHDPHVAAEWWEKHSNSPMGKQYAQMIRDEGKGHALARGQLTAIIDKGTRKGKAAGISFAGMVDEADKPKRGRKAKAKD